MDFETGIDTIEVSHWKVMHDMGDIRSHAEDRNGDLWIIDGKDALIIKDFARRKLDAGDFHFAN